MRILHTSDLHLGQTLYQHYERADEHEFFFDQLRGYIEKYRPDVLVVSGDIFDVQQPSATAHRAFTQAFASLRRRFPDVYFVLVAGNHDSASRIQSNSEVWALSDVTLVGNQPPLLPENRCEGWEKQYVVCLPSGFIIALPYMTSDRPEVALSLQKYVDELNMEELPVVMTAHMAVAGLDAEGHNFDVGTLPTVEVARLGSGFDYLALGHIHKPQTIGYRDEFDTESDYQAPVARYSGSVLHVSADERYPHSMSLVDIDRHGGRVHLTRLPIKQLRHFYTLPLEPVPFKTEKEAIKYIEKYLKDAESCYFRLRISTDADIRPDFQSKVYKLIETSGRDVRFNPLTLWVSPVVEVSTDNEEAPVIDVATLQQMDSPLDFVRLTIDQYPRLDQLDLDKLFAEIDEELRRMDK